MKNFFLLIIVIFLLGPSLSAQESHNQEVQDSSNVRYKIIPIAWFLPETGFAIGLTGLSTFRLSGEPASSRPSQIYFDAAYTFKNQILLFVPYELYWNNEDYRLKGEIGWYKYFYNFHGLGSNSRMDDIETYDVTFPRLVTQLTRKIYGPVFTGIGYKFDNFDIRELEVGGILETAQPTGYEGGRISNVFFSFLLDSRNDIFNPQKGLYIETFLERGIKSLGSSFSFSKIEVDARSFHALTPSLVLANNIYFMQVGEGAPFFQYPYLSTSRRGRGFGDRRFIDRALLNAQSELRFPIKGRFDGAVFASAGWLGDGINDLKNSSVKFAYGAGIRYVIDEKEGTKIRLDLGFSDEAFQVYITANESF